MMYVIQTKPNKEKYLLRELKHTGISAYVPEEKMNIRRRGKWLTQNRYIFSGYIFIDAEFSAELYQKVRRLSGYLHFLGVPAPLPADEEQQIKWLCNNDKPITTSHYTINNGKIFFIDGILKNADFEILKLYPRQKRARVSVKVNGRKFKVFLPIEKSEL